MAIRKTIKNMHTIDQQKFINAFLNEGSYKHLNTLVCGVTSKNDEGVQIAVENWINHEESLKWLAFMENVIHPEIWTEASEQAYQELLIDVQRGREISVNEWQERTKGKILLHANGQYFANSYVALAICVSLNKGVWKILEPAVENIKNQYPAEYNTFEKIGVNIKYKEIFPFVCTNSFEDVKWFYKLVYIPNVVLQRQNSYFATCMRLANKYLV